jgi:hypothetical protein
MTNTERKYREAKYFFERLDIDDPYFDFNLSAFLNAARSITWVMRHEFNGEDGWEKWFQEYYLPEKGRQLLKKINDLRIEATKKSGIKTDFFFLQTDMFVDEKYFPELEKIKDLEDGEYSLSVEPLSEEAKDEEHGAIRFVGEISRQNKPYDAARKTLKDRCEEYLILMEDIVTSCNSKFNILN